MKNNRITNIHKENIFLIRTMMFHIVKIKPLLYYRTMTIIRSDHINNFIKTKLRVRIFFSRSAITIKLYLYLLVAFHRNSILYILRFQK